MRSNEAATSTKWKVGLFSLGALLLIGAVTVLVNDRPYWWRPCDPVYIIFDDATGLKEKSPVRSLGLEIGYLTTVQLYGERVRLGICITAPVEVMSSTRAYIKGEGFLGDKFVELKPVKYVGDLEKRPSIPGEPDKDPQKENDGGASNAPQSPVQGGPATKGKTGFYKKVWNGFFSFVEILVSTVTSDAQAAPGAQREIPVGGEGKDTQQLINQVDGLVSELRSLTSNLKQAIDPKELKNTMVQLNKTLENASRTLSPEGGLNTTAQRTLAKLEEAIENLRDIMARVNRGQGSIGMLLNDPSYAEEIKDAIKNVNKLLGKVNEVRFVVNVGGEQIKGYEGGRAWFQIAIWPKRDRYYLLGATVDPRGKKTVKTTTTTSGGVTTVVKTTEIEDGGLLLNIMLGKVFLERLDLSLGLLHGDGTGSVALRLGPEDYEEMIQVRSDTYSRGKGYSIDDRISIIAKPFIRSKMFSTLYGRGGLESIRKIDGQTAWSIGGGIQFDDQDIKMLFAFLF